MKHILTIGKNRILFKPTTGLNYRPNRGMVGRGPMGGKEDGNEDGNEENQDLVLRNFTTSVSLTPDETIAMLQQQAKAEAKAKAEAEEEEEEGKEVRRVIAQRAEGKKENPLNREMKIRIRERSQMPEHDPQKDIKNVISRARRNIEQHEMFQEDKPKHKEIARKKVFEKISERREPPKLLGTPQILKVSKRRNKEKIKRLEEQVILYRHQIDLIQKSINNAEDEKVIKELKKEKELKIKEAEHLKDLIEQYSGAKARERTRGIKEYINSNPRFSDLIDTIYDYEQYQINFLKEKANKFYKGEGKKKPDIKGIIKKIDDRIIELEGFSSQTIKRREDIKNYTALRQEIINMEEMIASLRNQEVDLYNKLFDLYHGSLPEVVSETREHFEEAHKEHLGVRELTAVLDEYERSKGLESGQIINIDVSRFNPNDPNVKTLIQINETFYFDNSLLELNKEDDVRARTFSKNASSEVWIKQYLESVGYGDEKITAGKGIEYGICGKNNPTALMIFGTKKCNFRVSDHIIEDIYQKEVKPLLLEKYKPSKVSPGSSGHACCIDNIDTEGRIFNEMKDYKNFLRYTSAYNLQVRLKCQYLNNCKKRIKDAFILKFSSTDENIKREQEEIMNIYKDILKDEKSFLRSFYKEVPYIGIPITMNKWSKISLPEDYDYSKTPNTKAQFERIIKNQNQVFEPFMKDKFVIGMQQTGGISKDLMNERIVRDLFPTTQTKYSMQITVRLGDYLTLYNYTTDPYVTTDNILEFYRTAFNHGQTQKYNSVLIPIEKFEIKGFEEEL